MMEEGPQHTDPRLSLIATGIPGGAMDVHPRQRHQSMPGPALHSPSGLGCHPTSHARVYTSSSRDLASPTWTALSKGKYQPA